MTYAQGRATGAAVTAVGLTSPVTRGPEVEIAQKHLKKNEWGEFYHGPVDGKYGEETAQAASKARYQLGYPLDEVDRGHYGADLDGYITGAVALTPVMRARRVARRRKHEKEQKENTVRPGAITKRALEIALKEKGVHEQPPDSNRVKYSEWYGLTGPWCAMFFTWCQVKAAEDLNTTSEWRSGAFAAYCPYIVAAAQHRDHRLHITNDPEPGDAVLYQFDADSNADHIGRFVRWLNRGAGTFEAIEGNTSLTSNDNGGEVMLRQRTRSLVQHFVRVEE